MKKLFLSFLPLFFVLQLHAQQFKVIKFADLQELLHKETDSTYVINFWATWCTPCVKELPHFEKLQQQYKSKKVQVVLVSLDYVKDTAKRFIPFLEKRKLSPIVVLLDETSYNVWIDKVDESWGGSIPASYIYNHNKNFRQFYEQDFTFEELKNIVEPLTK